jgi:hypothetical protein
MDENGKTRNQPALADLCGITLEDVVAFDGARGGVPDPVLGLPDVDGSIFHYGSARTDHALCVGLSEQGRFGFVGGFVVCCPEADCKVVADVHMLDQTRLSARPFNRRGLFPGAARWPLAVTRTCGDGRVVYVAAQVEAENRRCHAPELDTILSRSILWAGGDAPIEAVDCPRSVEVRLFHNAERRAFQLMVVNVTTNPLTNVGYGPGVVRYVTPHKGLRFVFKTDEAVKDVRSQIGSAVGWEAVDGGVQIDLPLLDLYESVLVEYA